MIKVHKVEVQKEVLPEEQPPQRTGHGGQAEEPLPGGPQQRSSVKKRPVAGRLDGSLNQRRVRFL